ncbi:LCP family protein [Flaviflexus huanghaiensis]|uniref:LCP family protein n=1 Tax=Flaviflexus huanghaiensis TaxID=1111473 RepID=UPI0030CA26CF
MTGVPSYPPKNPAKRPSAAGATIIRGRNQRMSTPSESEDPVRQPVDRVARPDVPPPSFAPARRRGAPRPQQPLGLPMDEMQRPAPRPAAPPPAPPRQVAPGRPHRRRRVVGPLVLLLVIALVAWPVFLYFYGDSKLQHVEALSGAPNTPGRTVLFAGTDRRSEDGINDGVEGQRSDSIMLVHVPESGNPSLISLPRDTYVSIPRYGNAKLNAAYSVGGPQLLVETVEGLSGLTIDHYVEVGMDGISSLVDAVGGVELCLDYDVNDTMSGLVWEAGCHDSNGETALAFTRMRYSDPLGDIGRTARQRQVIAKIMDKAASPATLINPVRQYSLVGETTSALTVDEDMSLFELGRIALPMRTIMGPNGVIGTPPIVDVNYQPGGVGSTVLLDPQGTEEFFAKVADGSISQADVGVNLP